MDLQALAFRQELGRAWELPCAGGWAPCYHVETGTHMLLLPTCERGRDELQLRWCGGGDGAVMDGIFNEMAMNGNEWTAKQTMHTE